VDFASVFADGVAGLRGGQSSSHVPRALAFAHAAGNRLLDRGGFGACLEVFEHQGNRQDRPERVGLPRARVLGGGAVNRLEHGGPAGMDVAGGRHTQSSLQRGAQIRSNVSEHVVGDDHIELPRVPNHLHAQGVDEEV
jgi:hypothetical protein